MEKKINSLRISSFCSEIKNLALNLHAVFKAICTYDWIFINPVEKEVEVTLMMTRTPSATVRTTYVRMYVLVRVVRVYACVRTVHRNGPHIR